MQYFMEIKKADDNQTNSDLENARVGIDKINKDIVHLLARRMELAELVITAKTKDGIPVRNLVREKHILDTMAKSAEDLNLDPDYIRQIFRIIIDNTVSWENKNYKN